MSRAERLGKACYTPQHGFSTASKMKRRSVIYYKSVNWRN